MCGALIDTYLLESVRVAQQQEGERSYHIFYQLCAAAASAGADNTDAFPFFRSLGAIKDHHYLNQSTTTTIDGVDDKSEFDQTVKAMGTCGFSENDQADILSPELIDPFVWPPRPPVGSIRMD